jgi:hypothetical protein
MLKVPSRIELDALAGRRQEPAPPPAAPAPAPTPAPEPAPTVTVLAADPTHLDALQQAVTRMADNMARLPEMIAAAVQPPPPPTRLEGVVSRDSEGRLEKITITVVK